MNLDEAQRAKVSRWIAEGLKLSDIQNRLAAEFGLRLTYMDVRLLVDDLKLTPKDIERPKSTTLGSPAAPTAPAAAANKKAPPSPAPVARLRCAWGILKDQAPTTLTPVLPGCESSVRVGR